MGRLVNLFTDLENRRKVRTQAHWCRAHGATDEMMGHAIAVVLELANIAVSEEPTEQYLKSAAVSRIEMRMPGLDPATVLLLVQLIVMVYQALRAIGYLERDGLASVSPATISDYYGGL